MQNCLGTHRLGPTAHSEACKKQDVPSVSTLADATAQMPSYQVRVTPNHCDSAAQLQACDAKGAAPMNQAVGFADIYASRKVASTD